MSPPSSRNHVLHMKQRFKGISIAGALEFARLCIDIPPSLDEMGAGVDLLMFFTRKVWKTVERVGIARRGHRV